jgi:hypothetical protein
MEAQEVKLPHHFTPLYKKMKADGLINDDKKYVGEIPLAEYLKSQEFSTESPNSDLEEPDILPQKKEESIPVSQVSEMVAKMVADQMKNFQIPAQQPNFQTQSQPKFKEENNIDDIPELRNWEMKDREYELCDTVKPISCSIAKEHTATMPLQYTNKETQAVHIMRYATNQPSFFIEKQSKEPGSVLVADVIFNYGRLKVPANNVTLQKFLAIHPHLNVVFREYDPLAKSKQVVADKKLKLKASNLVFTVGEITNRAIASLEFPNYVDSWDVELLEEEVLAFSEKSPQKYIDYTNDPTIKMKGVIKASLASGDLIYSNYRFLNKKRETILEVAKNQNEMDELVLYFESGVGRTFYEYLLNKI